MGAQNPYCKTNTQIESRKSLPQGKCTALYPTEMSGILVLVIMLHKYFNDSV